MVLTEHEAKSMSQETTFARDVRDDTALERTVRQLAGDVAGYLRKSNLAGSTIRLKLRWPDFSTLTRQSTLPQRTDDETIIAGTALTLLHACGSPVRRFGSSVSV